MTKKLCLVVILLAISGCTGQQPTGGIEYGNLIFKDGIAYCEETPFTGIAVEYYDNGSLLYRDSFLNGKLNGVCKAWYENGKPIYEENYTEGIPHGRWLLWDKNEQVRSIEFENGARITN